MLLPRVTFPRHTLHLLLSPPLSQTTCQPVEWTMVAIFLFCPRRHMPARPFSFLWGLLSSAVRPQHPANLTVNPPLFNSYVTALREISPTFPAIPLHSVLWAQLWGSAHPRISPPPFQLDNECRAMLSPDAHDPWETCPCNACESRTLILEHSGASPYLGLCLKYRFWTHPRDSGSVCLTQVVCGPHFEKRHSRNGVEVTFKLQSMITCAWGWGVRQVAGRRSRRGSWHFAPSAIYVQPISYVVLCNHY